MAEKITYILGAGASYNAFPLVKPAEKWGMGLAMDVLTLSDKLKVAGLHGKIFESLEETGRRGEEFGNIDTYAKYLYHTRQHDKLKELKLALTFYFLNAQVCFKQKHSDKRYLNFVTSIVNDQNLFPDNVKILSWNYDFLLENAVMMYGEDDFFEGDKVSKHSPSFASYFPSYGYEFQLTHKDYVDEGFSIAHLNGIAGFYIKQNKTGNGVFHSVFNDLKRSNMKSTFTQKDLIDYFNDNYLDKSHLMTFAWEKRAEVKRSLVNGYEIAKSIIKDTTILVVIGYSFPFYNREVDNMIIEEMAPSLKILYFQDPNINGEFLRDRYGEIVRRHNDERTGHEISTKFKDYIQIRHITDTDQFYIPVEL